MFFMILCGQHLFKCEVLFIFLNTANVFFYICSNIFTLGAVFWVAVCHKEAAVSMGRTGQTPEKTVGEVCPAISHTRPAVAAAVLRCDVLHCQCSQDH